MIGSLEKLEALNQQRQVVPVDRPKVFHAELFKHDRWPENALGSLFSTARNLDGRLAAEALDESRCRLVQMLVVLVGNDPMEVACDCADVAIDGPLVVVENHDQALGLLGDVVHRFKRDAVGKCGVACHCNHVLGAAGQVARNSHAQRCRKRSARVPGAEAVVLAFGAEHKAVESARLANRVEAIAAASKNFVDVGLVAHVEHDLVFGSIKDRVQGHGQFDHAEIWSKVAAGLRQRLNQEFTDLLRQLRHLRFIQAL